MASSIWHALPASSSGRNRMWWPCRRSTSRRPGPEAWIRLRNSARLTGMQVAFGKAMDYAGGQYGEAILSRWPLEDVHVLDLPYSAGCEPRCVIAARVQLPDGGPSFVFASTHLEHAQATVRLCQAGKLSSQLAYVKELPVILAGDFNAEPASLPMSVLRRHWSSATADESLPTFPADQPRVMLDHVVFRPESHWQVLETQVVDEPLASDHPSPAGRAGFARPWSQS